MRSAAEAGADPAAHVAAAKAAGEISAAIDAVKPWLGSWDGDAASAFRSGWNRIVAPLQPELDQLSATRAAPGTPAIASAAAGAVAGVAARPAAGGAGQVARGYVMVAPPGMEKLSVRLTDLGEALTAYGPAVSRGHGSHPGVDTGPAKAWALPTAADMHSRAALAAYLNQVKPRPGPAAAAAAMVKIPADAKLDGQVAQTAALLTAAAGNAEHRKDPQAKALVNAATDLINKASGKDGALFAQTLMSLPAVKTAQEKFYGMLPEKLRTKLFAKAAGTLPAKPGMDWTDWSDALEAFSLAGFIAALGIFEYYGSPWHRARAAAKIVQQWTEDDLEDEQVDPTEDPDPYASLQQAVGRVKDLNNLLAEQFGKNVDLEDTNKTQMARIDALLERLRREVDEKAALARENDELKQRLAEQAGEQQASDNEPAGVQLDHEPVSDQMAATKAGAYIEVQIAEDSPEGA